MTDEITQSIPVSYKVILKEIRSWIYNGLRYQTCSLLKTLATAKPNGELLELGTGSGLSTSWILEGMNSNAGLVSIGVWSISARKCMGH